MSLARQHHDGLAEILSDASLAAAFGSVLWVLTGPQLSRRARNTAVLCLGVTPTLMWRATNPVLFTGFDEQLHMRTLGDILSSHRLFQANPLLQVSPRYPGLEAVTVLVHQAGLPLMAAATIVIIAARVVLVTVLCDAVEQLTGSGRAGGLAVAVYAVSPQFVAFNSQFAYQTLAIPPALGAVSLIARARRSDHPVPLLGGATVCLLSVAITHHVTSLLTAAFLLVWAVLQRRSGSSRVAYGALAAIASTLAWAILQRALLANYFGPIFDDVVGQLGGDVRRKTFEDSAGAAAPLLDRILLLYYAAALTFLVVVMTLVAVRWSRRGVRHLHRSGPHLLVLMLAGAIPVLMAARVVPMGGELFDRASSFLFLALSLIVAQFAVRSWWQGPADTRPKHGNRALSGRAGRIVGVTLAAGLFLGGYVLGSGPNWARLPGSYMVSADARSMDAEVLAAVEWAHHNLPAGSRVGADRVGSDLLAARAGVWPVMKAGGISAPSLYFADDFGLPEMDAARSLQLRFLFVDRRLADDLPHFGSYFEKGEPKRRLTDAQLAKFDDLRGITPVYRHGPISIYDLKNLGAPELRSGWYEATPSIRVADQLAVGLLSGLLIALVMRSRLWPRIVEDAVNLRHAWGPAGTAAVVLAGTCLVSTILLLAHVWITPLVLVSAAIAVVLSTPHAMAAMVRRGAAKLSWRGLRAAGLVALPAAIIVGFALHDAASEDTRVQQILDDPSAVHIPPPA